MGGEGKHNLKLSSIADCLTSKDTAVTYWFQLVRLKTSIDFRTVSFLFQYLRLDQEEIL